MRLIPSAPAAALVILASLLAAACGANRNPLEVRVQRCPAIAVVGGTATYTQFAGDGRTAEDVVLNAAITDLKLNCDQDDEVVSTVSFEIFAERGPAMRHDAALSLPYFVAVVRDNSEIVAKRIYEARLDFSGGADRAGRREILRQVLPTIEQARRYDYEIVLGFQLTPEDVAYNLQR